MDDEVINKTIASVRRWRRAMDDLRHTLATRGIVKPGHACRPEPHCTCGHNAWYHNDNDESLPSPCGMNDCECQDYSPCLILDTERNNGGMSTKAEQAKAHLATCIERDDFPSHNCACNCDDVAELLAENASLRAQTEIDNICIGILEKNNQRLRAAYQQIENASNEDIRKLAVAHMWTVLNEAFGMP